MGQPKCQSGLTRRICKRIIKAGALHKWKIFVVKVGAQPKASKNNARRDGARKGTDSTWVWIKQGGLNIKSLGIRKKV